MLQVQIGSRQKHVHARPYRSFQSAQRGFDVGAAGPGQTSHSAVANFTGYRAHGLEITLGGDGKARFNNVHTQVFELPGEAQFLRRVHRKAG